ncbi:hypothetical protein GGI04_005110, partial [Coemansia thaxteri]
MSAALVPNSLKVADLRKELAARNLPTTGLKKDLVERLENALAAPSTHSSASTPVQVSNGTGEGEGEDHIDLMPAEEAADLDIDLAEPSTTNGGLSGKDSATNPVVSDTIADSIEMADADETHGEEDAALDAKRKRAAEEHIGHAHDNPHMDLDEKDSLAAQSATRDSLYIKNLERPLTVYRLKEMLSKYGSVNDVWLNSIKTRGYASFGTEEQAKAAFSGTNGTQFPPEYGKVLECGLITLTRMKELVAAEEASPEAVRQVDLVPVPVEDGNCGVALINPNAKSGGGAKKQKTDKPTESKVKGGRTEEKTATQAAETAVLFITSAAAAAANEAKNAADQARKGDANILSRLQGAAPEPERLTAIERDAFTRVTKAQPEITYRPLTDDE